MENHDKIGVGLLLAAVGVIAYSIGHAQGFAAHECELPPVQPDAPAAPTPVKDDFYTGEYTSTPSGTTATTTAGPILLKKGKKGIDLHPFLKTFEDESDAIAAGYKHGDRFKTKDGSVWKVNSI